jgi:pimeloyl-ACP methyl ester carboxylesterase/membrane protease YdiL (CAAX protease family)
MSSADTTQPAYLAGPFFEAARSGNNRWWAYLSTLFLALVLTTAATATLLVPLLVLYPASPLRPPGGVYVLTQAPAPLVLLVTLLPFAGVHLALWAGLRALHRRPLRSLVSPGGAFRWRLLLLSFGLWLALSGLADLVQYLVHPAVYRWNFDPAIFWPYLAVALLLLPVQTSAEELLFRGYLTQAAGLKARRLWLPLLLPALFFGLLHLPNPEVGAYGPAFTLPQYLGMGLLLGWVTLRSQGLELAIGLHLANNLYAGLVAGLPGGALPSATLITIETVNPMLNLILLFAAAALFIAITARIHSHGHNVRPGATLLSLLLIMLAAGVAGCAPGSTLPPVPATPERLLLEPCLLSSPGLSSQVDARCGKLEVPENPADPAGRKISLNIAVIKAQSSNPAPDPLVLLAGGPGQAATEAFLPLLPVLERVTFKRDVLLVDQRGTGKSNPLRCADAADSERPVGEIPSPDEVKAAFEKCVGSLDADTRYYTTDIAMQDLEAVRQALGYEKINLLGVSYGTRAALTYMRLYPENVRTVVLDAVVPPGWLIGESVRRDAQTALDAIFARCAADAACNKAFPGLSAEFNDRARPNHRRRPAGAGQPSGGRGDGAPDELFQRILSAAALDDPCRRAGRPAPARQPVPVEHQRQWVGDRTRVVLRRTVP